MLGRLLVGTSGWAYDDWVGRFYPLGLDRNHWLSHYAKEFSCVELNVTFYRLPFANMIVGWSRKVPDEFVFIAKGSRVVTHRLRLRNAKDEVEKFEERLKDLKGLEVILWQLPPSLRADPDLLSEFISILPTKFRFVIEFRHVSWWENSRVAEVLKAHGAAFCGVSHPRLPDEMPDTADFAYIRFHGLGPRLYDYDYSEQELLPWAEKAALILASGRDVYAFFNNDYRANAVFNAKLFRSLVLRLIQDHSGRQSSSPAGQENLT